MIPRQDFDDGLRAGQSAFASGDYSSAAAVASQLLAFAPGRTEARILRVNARLKLEHWREAIGDLHELIAAQPQQPQLRRLLGLCWLRIGNASKADGDTDAAITAYRNAIDADATTQDARHNLGALLLALDRATDALPLLASVAAAEPGNDLAALDLVRVHFANRDDESALGTLRDLAKRSDNPETWQACASLFLDHGHAEDATAVGLRVATASTPNWEWTLHLAKRLRDNVAAAASRELLDALAKQPLDPAARLCVDIHAALGLPSVYADVAGVVAARDAFKRGLDRLVADYPADRVAQIAPPPEHLMWDNFYLAYQGCNDRDLQQRFGDWYCAVLAAALPSAIERPLTPGRSRPKIALVSGRFHLCTVGMYYAAWIEYLAAHDWEVTLVHVGGYRDAWTEHLARSAHAELTLTGAFADRAQRLRELNADIVLYPELGMDSTVFALAALRLGAVQVCAWGHPSTTGLPTIDAFLSCANMEPADAVGHYREHLLLLPGLGTRYPQPPVPDAPTRTELDLPQDRSLYLIPQSAFKLHPHNDAVFCRIVENDPSALLVFFADREPGAISCLRTRVISALNPVTQQPDRHFVFLAQRSREEYLRVNLVCDVMVDSLDWSGGNTTLDALHCGLPVVTCPGVLMRGRQSAAMLRALDCAELIADSPRELANLAVAIVHDRGRRDELKSRIAANLPGLTGSDRPLQALDAILRNLLPAAHA